MQPTQVHPQMQPQQQVPPSQPTMHQQQPVMHQQQPIMQQQQPAMQQQQPAMHQQQPAMHQQQPIMQQQQPAMQQQQPIMHQQQPAMQQQPIMQQQLPPQQYQMQQQWQPPQQQLQQQPPQLQQQPQMMNALQNERPGFNKKVVYFLGIIQIVFGCICIVLQAIAIGTASGLYFIGHGIWCSVFYLIAGGLSIGASTTLKTCMIVSSMVLSIFAAIFSAVHLGLSAGSIPFIQDNYWYDEAVIPDGLAIFLQVVALLISLAEFNVAIATSVYDCKGTCTSAQGGQSYQSVQYVTMADGRTVPVVIPGPNTTPGQPNMINPGMVMPQQQPGPSVQAEAPPAYQAPTECAPQETKEQL